MKNECPVFIVGAGRSGTSILYRILQKHSSFKPEKCTSESGVQLTETSIFRNSFKVYDDRSRKIALNYFLSNETYYVQYLESTKWIRRYQCVFIGKRYFYKLSRKIKPLSFFLWRISLNHYVAQVFFYYAKQARGMKRILEKTPSHILYLKEIKATFPRSKLLFIHRHPIDVYSSHKKRLKKDSVERGVNKKGPSWLKISPREFSNKYAMYISLALKEYGRNSHGFMPLRYDELVSNPQIFLHRICEFLDEPYEEKCIPESKNENDEGKSYTHLYSGIEKKTKNWRDFISEVDARCIEDRLDKVMRELGYPRYTFSKSTACD